MDKRFARPWLARANYPLDWNAPEGRAFVPFAHDNLERPVIDLFAEQADRHAARPAVDDGTERLSYAELSERMKKLAARIAARTRPGDPVGVLLPASADFSAAMLACFATGRLFVPLDLHYPKAWIADLLASAGVAAVIGRFDGEARDLVPSGLARIDIAKLPDKVRDGRYTSVGPDEPALVIFTSGSTGKPKGIVNSQRNLLRRVEHYVNAAHIDADDRFMPLSSGCTIAGLRERLSALLCGATLYPIDVQRAGARQILARLEETATTMIYAVPALLRTLVTLAPKGPSHLRVVRVGGDAVLWSDIDLLRGWLPEDCRIELGYSSTEAPILQWFVPRDFPRDGVRIPIGYPLEDDELAILDADGAPVAAGEEGELTVKSPYVALGHWREGRCDPSPFSQAEDDPTKRVLRTGDLVRLRSDGFLDLIGRKDRQIKIRGIRVEPGELEAALRAQDGVEDAAVLPRKLGSSISLVGYAVPRVDAPADLAATLKQTLKAALPAHLQPQRVYPIEAIPRLPSGKLDVRALEILDRAHQAEDAQTPASSAPQGPPANAVEAAVAAIWSRLLDRPHIGRDEDFFDLGGDSLKTLDMMFALEEELGVDLPITIIFEAPTVAALSAAIEARATPSASLLVKMKEGDGAPLFVVHGVGGNVMELFGFGRRIRHMGPVYAIQARGLDGGAEPARAIVEMADAYLDAIRDALPDGPYHLAGYSTGGLIAFEMARRLADGGAAPASLTLLDTQTNARQWPMHVWFDVLRRRLRHHRAATATFTLGARLRYFARVFAGLRRRIAWRFGLDDAARPLETPSYIPDALQKVYAATLAAAARYRPGCYGHPVTLIASEAGDPMMADPRRIWPAHAHTLTIRTSPGNHYSMIQGTNAARLADTLSDVLAAHAAA